METLQWMYYEENFQFVPDTGAHAAVLREARVVFALVSDVLVTKRPPEIGEVSRMCNPDEMGLNKYAFKRFLIAQHLNAHAAINTTPSAPKQQQQPQKVPSAIDVEWKEMINSWDNRKEATAFSASVDGTPRAWQPFHPDHFALGTHVGFEWNVTKQNSSSLKLEFKKKKMTKATGAIPWNICHNNSRRSCVSTPEIRAELAGSGNDIHWVEVAGVILAETDVTNTSSLRAFCKMVNDVREAMKEYEKNKHDEKVNQRYPPETLLDKSNFYPLIAQQLEANPSQTAFYFYPLHDESKDKAFRAALDRSKTWKRSSIPFSKKHMVSERKKNDRGEDTHTFASVLSDSLFLVVILHGACLLFACIEFFDWLISTNADAAAKSVVLMASSGIAFFILLLIFLVIAALLDTSFQTWGKRLKLKT